MSCSTDLMDNLCPYKLIPVDRNHTGLVEVATSNYKFKCNIPNQDLDCLSNTNNMEARQKCCENTTSFFQLQAENWENLVKLDFSSLEILQVQTILS